MKALLRVARLIAAKDLRIERRSRVAITQIVGFAVLVLFLFAFAFDPTRGVLARATPGLFWIAVLLSLLLVVGRNFAAETADGALDGLRMAGLEPGGIFLGKFIALLVELLALVVVLLAGVVVFYDTEIPAAGAVLLVTSAFLACTGLAAAGTVYGALSAGVRVRETLLPLLLLPVVAPVLIGATRAFEAALGTPSDDQRAVASVAEGWPWVALLGVFAVMFVAGGLLSFGTLLED